jgi:hypothetical protein
MVHNRDRKSFGSHRKITDIAQTKVAVDVFVPRSDISGPTSRRAFKYLNIHDWWTQVPHLRCPVAQLMFLPKSGTLSPNISLWIWSIISGMFTVLCRPGRGTSQVEKSPRLNLTIQFLTVANYAVCSPYVTIRMSWISFGAMPSRKNTHINDSKRLDVVEIARVDWHALFQPVLQGKACNSTHEQTPLSNDTIESVLRYFVLCRVKNMSVFPRILYI